MKIEELSFDKGMGHLNLKRVAVLDCHDLHFEHENIELEQEMD